jgi:hypothetical protein
VDELGVRSCGGLDSLTAWDVSRAVADLLASADQIRTALRAARDRLAARAATNLDQAPLS